MEILESEWYEHQVARIKFTGLQTPCCLHCPLHMNCTSLALDPNDSFFLNRWLWKSGSEQFMGNENSLKAFPSYQQGCLRSAVPSELGIFPGPGLVLSQFSQIKNEGTIEPHPKYYNKQQARYQRTRVMLRTSYHHCCFYLSSCLLLLQFWQCFEHPSMILPPFTVSHSPNTFPQLPSLPAS